MKHFILVSLIVLFHCVYVSTAFSGENKLKIKDGEILNLEITTKDNERFIAQTTYGVIEKNGNLFFSYVNKDNRSLWEVETDAKAFPIKIKYSKKGNKMQLDFDGKGGVILTGYWNGKKIEQKNEFMKNVTLENALVVRTLELDNFDEYIFDLLQTSKFPSLESYKMYFKVLGEETVGVKAGTFNCKKILFSIKGWKGIFYKAYYFVSNDEHRYLVKIENMPRGGSTELISIE